MLDKYSIAQLILSPTFQLVLLFSHSSCYSQFHSMFHRPLSTEQTAMQFSIRNYYSAELVNPLTPICYKDIFPPIPTQVAAVTSLRIKSPQKIIIASISSLTKHMQICNNCSFSSLSLRKCLNIITVCLIDQPSLA